MFKEDRGKRRLGFWSEPEVTVDFKEWGGGKKEIGAKRRRPFTARI